MKHFLLCVSAVSLSMTPAWADDGGAECEAVYKRLKSEMKGDMSVCEKPVAEPVFEQCQAPSNYTAERPASHVVLILDASGSMAGKAGKETKMSVAKREATKFLEDLESDIPVGLIVYGHKGNNKETGKAESCAATEWVHEVGGRKTQLSKSINALKPTGWTPLGLALEYANIELAKLPLKKDDEISAPVVYIISDGKETCGGDPVGAAKALHESGVRAAVNVIGFDVDAETRTQLEAISEAGGGRYFPADDSSALRKQLDAILESERSMARYKYCININKGRAAMVYHNAKVDVVSCFQTEAKKKRYNILKEKAKAMAASSGPESVCAKTVKSSAYSDFREDQRWMVKKSQELTAASKDVVAKAEAASIFNALDPKEQDD